MSGISTGRADQRLRVLVGIAVCLGLASVAAALAMIVAGGGPLPPVPAPWWLLVTPVGLLVAAEWIRVHIRIRSTIQVITWADAAILISLALLPIPWVILGAAVGTVIAKLLRRLAPAQVAFAAAKESTTALTGGLVLLALGAAGTQAAPTGPAATDLAPAAPLSTAAVLAAFTVAFMAMTLVDLALALPVIATATRTRVRDRLRSNWDIEAITLVGRLLVALGAVVTLPRYPELLYGLALVTVVAHLWHERWVRAREERRAWQQLSRATERFTGVDLDVVLPAAVTEGTDLFSADELEIEIWLGTTYRLVRADAAGLRYDGDPAKAPADACNVYAVALHGYAGQRDIGALRLRFHRQITMTDRDQAMLQAYAAALDTAIRNAAAYGRLGEATAAHAHAAAHDPLTGLANRRELERRLTEQLAQDSQIAPSTAGAARPAAGSAAAPAVMLIDLRHFKIVNDGYGHLVGDEVLRQVAQRFLAAVEPGDLVCRFGGDEFAVLFDLGRAGAPSSAEAERRAWRVVRALADPILVDGAEILIDVDAGLALGSGPESTGRELRGYQPADHDPDTDDLVPQMNELLRRADVAMYQARRNGQPLAWYRADEDPRDPERLALAGQLAAAVSRREFSLHFQPIVDLAAGTVVGAEALARWDHPTRGQLEPRFFLELLERSHHLAEFTAGMLDAALTAADMWREGGHDLTVSVNISTRSLLDQQLPRQVVAALDAHRTPPERLCLELTETSALSRLEATDRTLQQLRDLGVKVALDDFGTGFSNLAVLPRIQVDQLKIDKYFVQRMHTDGALEALAGTEGGEVRGFPAGVAGGLSRADEALAVVRNTIKLAQSLGLTLVAEGIENERQRHALWQLGCRSGQGHLFARAMPADQLLGLLSRGIAGVAGALAAPIHDPTVVRLSERGARKLRRRRI